MTPLSDVSDDSVQSQLIWRRA